MFVAAGLTVLICLAQVQFAGIGAVCLERCIRLQTDAEATTHNFVETRFEHGIKQYVNDGVKSRIDVG